MNTKQIYIPSGFHIVDSTHEYAAKTLAHGRYAVITATFGCGKLPTKEDWLLCIYESEDAFLDGENPAQTAASWDDEAERMTVDTAIDKLCGGAA